MIQLVNSGIIDEGIYSLKRNKYVVNSQRLMGGDAYDIEVFKNGYDIIQLGMSDNADLIGMGANNTYKIDMYSGEVYIDNTDGSLDYAEPIIIESNKVKIDGAMTFTLVESDIIEINSNLYLGDIYAEMCNINIKNSDQVGIYSFELHSESIEESLKITYNGNEVFRSNGHIPDNVYIVAIDDAVWVCNSDIRNDRNCSYYTEAFAIKAINKMKECKEYFTISKEDDEFLSTYDFDLDDVIFMTIYYNYEACKVQISGNIATFNVKVEKLCGRNVLSKEISY